MQLRHIAFASLNRRKGRFAFLLVALTLGVGTVITLVSLSTAMRAAVSDELDRFGANIIVTPRSQSISLAYGGLDIGDIAVDSRALASEDAGRIRTIPNSRNISTVAPKLVGTVEIDNTRVVLVGVDFRQERRVKGWWTNDGQFAATTDDVMLGADASRMLQKGTGDTLMLGDRPRRVTAVRPRWLDRGVLCDGHVRSPLQPVLLRCCSACGNQSRGVCADVHTQPVGEMPGH
jgi:putative ABC transport system permease protein